MAKTPATVLAEINQYIIANGVGAISGPILNGVLQDICDLVPPTPLDSGLMGYDSSGNPLAVSGGGGGGTPGGSSGDLQYNNAGAFGGYGVGSGLSVVGGNLTATGGGGTGLPFVTSIAALQALTPATGNVVYLNTDGRSGAFAWSAANLSTAVTNDPGQGITIAPASDTTGASGAWVRQYSGPVYWAWWGIVADGSTDNSAAFNQWNTWARTQAGVTAVCPVGQINFNLNSCFGAFYGIAQFDLHGYGTTFQNTGTGSTWSFFYASNPNLHNPGFLINTTAVGQTSVTCVTPTDAGNFVIGSSAAVMSLDIQYFGYPPCCDQFDFVTVTGVNTSTGVVSFSGDILRYIHRADFPDGPQSQPCGKARIWLFDSTQNNDSRGALPCPWNVRHVYRGITINQLSGGATYWQQSGRSIKCIDCTTIGVSATQAGYVGFERHRLGLQCEIDKLVDRVEFLDCRDNNVVNNVQTSSVNLLTARNCNFAQFQSGNAKHTIIDSCNIEAFNDGGYPYGCPRDVVIINSLIQSYPTPPYLASLTNQNLTVDGTNTTYANGVFTVLNAGVFPNGPLLWNNIIGNEIVLEQPTIGHPGDKGVGYVTAMQDVGSGGTAAIQITTTLPYANLAAASWASGGVAIKRRGRVFVYGSSGCDVINNLNDGTFLKYLPGEYWRALLFGITATTMNPATASFVGELIELDVNVIQATAISGAGLIFTSFAAVTPPLLTPPGVTYTIAIDLTTAGQRIFTLAGLLGKQPGDSIVLNSIGQNSLPAVWCGSSGPLGMRINYTPSSSTPNLLPVVEIIMKFSTGITGKLVPLLQTAGVTGQIP